MNTIHIVDAERRQQAYDLPEAQRLWNEGAIAADSLYWQDGMPEWRPVTELFNDAPTQAVTAGLPPSAPVLSSRGFVKNPITVTKTLIVMLWIYLSLAAVSVLLSAITLATGQTGGSGIEEMTPLEMASLLIGLPQFLVVIVTAVFFLMWIHRANFNARGLGAQGMTFTPGWSVGWYFVPFANLWKPYQAMKEIWQASANPHAWRTQTPPTLLSAWWTLWIISNVVSNLSFRLSLQAETSGAVMASEIVSIITDLLDIPLCLVAMRLVREIIRLQTQWAGEAPQSICAICQQPVDPSELVYINQTSVCARCKPILLQQIQEGVAGQ